MDDQKYLLTVLLTYHLLQSVKLCIKEPLKIQAGGLSLQPPCFKHPLYSPLHLPLKNVSLLVQNTGYTYKIFLASCVHPPTPPSPCIYFWCQWELFIWDTWDPTRDHHQVLHYFPRSQGDKTELTVKIEKWWYKLIKVHFLTLEVSLHMCPDLSVQDLIRLYRQIYSFIVALPSST